MCVCVCVCVCMLGARARACVHVCDMFWTERSSSLRATIVHLVKTHSKTELFCVPLFGSSSSLVTGVCWPMEETGFSERSFHTSSPYIESCFSAAWYTTVDSVVPLAYEDLLLTYIYCTYLVYTKQERIYTTMTPYLGTAQMLLIQLQH